MTSNKKYTAAGTSKADKVIDALEQVTQSSKPTYVCSDCGNTSFTVRSPLGGPKIKVCTRCNSKRYSAGYSGIALLPENLTHGQGTRKGPTRSSMNTKNKPNTKNQPKYRSKGKKL